jgi:tRNA(fMet)-specific endonuclease VapC
VIWLLDTNVLIHAQRGRPQAVEKRLQSVSPDDVATTVVSVAEINCGIFKSADPQRKRELWDTFLSPIKVLDFDVAAASAHAEIRFALRKHPIGERDLLIASIALSRQLTVVTNNTKEFQRVPGLQVEDWTET